MRSAAQLDFKAIDFDGAQARLAGQVRRTPLQPFASGDARIELRLKLECLQEVGAFKARGAWNQIAQLDERQRARGVVTMSSGNHGKALAWAAQRAGVRATIVMPVDAYPNKIQACRDCGAEVVLAPSRAACERECDERVAAGAVMIHPYDAERTIEGAGTVGLEIAQQWPEVELVLVPVGGGGLVSGIALALQRARGNAVRVVGIEPEGAATLRLGVEAGEPVSPPIESQVQGLCPPQSGRWNIAIARAAVHRLVAQSDAQILAAQARLVNEGGWTVEPAGAAGAALVLNAELERLLPELIAGRDAQNPLRVCAVVSGGNPDPAQLAAVRARARR